MIDNTKAESNCVTSPQQSNILVVCGEAYSQPWVLLQGNWVFSCRLHLLLMLTWGQDAPQQESGKLSWVSVTLASDAQICKGGWESFRVWHQANEEASEFKPELVSVTVYSSRAVLWRVWRTLDWSDFVCVCVGVGVLYLSLWETLYPQRDSFRRGAAQSTHSP